MQPNLVFSLDGNDKQQINNRKMRSTNVKKRKEIIRIFGNSLGKIN